MLRGSGYFAVVAVLTALLSLTSAHTLQEPIEVAVQPPMSVDAQVATDADFYSTVATDFDSAATGDAGSAAVVAFGSGPAADFDSAPAADSDSARAVESDSAAVADVGTAKLDYLSLRAAAASFAESRRSNPSSTGSTIAVPHGQRLRNSVKPSALETLRGSREHSAMESERSMPAAGAAPQEKNQNPRSSPSRSLRAFTSV